MKKHSYPDFIKDLISFIDKNDFSGAKNLLDHFSAMGYRDQIRALFHIGNAEDDISCNLLSHLCTLEISNPDVTNALSDLVLDKAHSSTKFIIPYLATAKDEEIKEAAPLLVSILRSEVDVHILKEIISSLGRSCGSILDETAVTTVADFIFYDNDELKTAAVLALGDMGGPIAVSRLGAASRTSKSDRLITDTLAKLTRDPGGPEIPAVEKDQPSALKNLINYPI